MKSLTVFLQCVLSDLGRWCCTSTSQDLKKVLARIKHEGDSFLTITLPRFGKDFERSLDQGMVDPSSFPGFQRKGGLPLFLGGFLDQVFDRGTGRLVDKPSLTAIWAIRQFTLMFAKINLDCSTERREAALRRFIDCEREVREADARRASIPGRVEAYRRIGTLLWADVFCFVDQQISQNAIIPKHGSGNTADRIRGNAKWDQSEWTDRLEQVFPAGEHLVSSWKYREVLAGVRYLEPGAERPVRVVTVPKTLEKPRIIAIEPTCMQYMQQGLMAAIREGLQQDRLCWDLIGWGSQVPNQRLASQGSRDDSLGTLDLSEASDRVSEQHVLDLLRNHSLLAEAVDSCRSRKAVVPVHGDDSLVISLAKFASMGSALCFPFEAMVFCTMIFVAIEEELSRPLTRKDIQSFRHRVRVYGDDIIVPVRYVQAVIEVLEDFGLRVNSGKSFWTGKFRESCGREYYNGEDVSIVRLRSVLPSSLQDGPAIVSTVSTRNQLYKAGMWGTAAYLDEVLTACGLPLPRVSDDAGVLGRQSFLGPDLSGKLHRDTHQPLVWGGVVKSTIPTSKLDGVHALLKCLTQLESTEPSVSRVGSSPPARRTGRDVGPRDNIWELRNPDVNHLDRSGRPQRPITIKLRWAPAT